MDAYTMRLTDIKDNCKLFWVGDEAYKVKGHYLPVTEINGVAHCRIEDVQKVGTILSNQTIGLNQHGRAAR